MILFLAITTSITIFTFTLIHSHEPIPVFDINDILFEHQTIHGNLIISTDPYDELTLAFASRKLGNLAYSGSTTAVIDSDITYLTLPATDTIPFTTHTVVSTDSNLYQVIVIETGSPIAYHANAKKTARDDTTVFMVSSADLTGSEAFIIGLTVNNEIILEIEIP